MTDLKDRGQVDSLSVIPGGVTEDQSTSAPMPGVMSDQSIPQPEDNISVAPNLERPDIDPSLEQLGVAHGKDSIKISRPAIDAGIQPAIPSTGSINNWPISLEDARKFRKGKRNSGRTWESGIEVMQDKRVKELRKAV